jgi:2-polyprenyl-3-methyl-5-hydroxy-6-metoxy-1,4-benzoquinol methylase
MISPEMDINSRVGSSRSAQYWEQRLEANWGLHGVGHISYGAEYNRWLYKVRRRVFEREVAALGVDWTKTDVLDTGSGTGVWIDAWRSLGVRSITGSDLTRTAVDRLRQAYPESQILQLDISGPLENRSGRETYDVISAFDVLFHIVDDDDFAAALGNIAKLLRPGGLFIFSDNFLHRGKQNIAHQSNRTLEHISRAVSKAGFNIERRVPMFIFMNTPIDVESELLVFLWRLWMLPVHLVPFLGRVYGPILYPIELHATRAFSESPSTEMMICRKRHL